MAAIFRAGGGGGDSSGSKNHILREMYILMITIPDKVLSWLKSKPEVLTEIDANGRNALHIACLLS